MGVTKTIWVRCLSYIPSRYDPDKIYLVAAPIQSQFGEERRLILLVYPGLEGIVVERIDFVEKSGIDDSTRGQKYHLSSSYNSKRPGTVIKH
jgi:hypothetical protein